MSKRRTAPLVGLVLLALIAGCSPDAQDQAVSTAPDVTAEAATDPTTRDEPERDAAQLGAPQAPTTVLPPGTAEELAVATSAALFESAPVVVLAPVDDPSAQERAARAAVAAGMPLLLTGPATPLTEPSASVEPSGLAPSGGAGSPTTLPDASQAEVDRLQAGAALAFGRVPDGYADVEVVMAPDADGELADLLDVPAVAVEAAEPVAAAAALVPGELTSPSDPSTTSDPSSSPDPSGPTAPDTADPSTGDELPPTKPGAPLEDVLVLSTGEPAQLAAVATARAAGADVLLVPGGDPRATSATVQAFAGREPTTTVALGPGFGDASTLEQRMTTAATGVELPGGGQLALPGKTYVALYGSPVTASLGVLGEQGPEATVQRAQEHASWYTDLTGTTVVPTLEVIATVASGQAGSDGNYSNEWPVEDLRPLVDLAGQNGQYVVLDLQPGRTDFLTQAQRYEQLLLEPHVGLALDPEWRLAPDQRHLRQIGQVSVEEVDTVVTWLADLTRDNDLPQKLLVLHQFQVRMIPGSDAVDQSRSELAVLVHVDGQGSQPAKQDTWRVLRRNAPSIRWWGWKNFYDEDTPMLTPEQTVQVEPTPNFVSYQ